MNNENKEKHTSEESNQQETSKKVNLEEARAEVNIQKPQFHMHEGRSSWINCLSLLCIALLCLGRRSRCTAGHSDAGGFFPLRYTSDPASRIMYGLGLRWSVYLLICFCK